MKVDVLSAENADGLSVGDRNMIGISPNQPIWAYYRGSLITTTLSHLRSEELIDRLPLYKILTTTDPTEPCTSVTPSTILTIGSTLMVRVTDVNDKSITMPATGMIYDMDERYPFHYIVSNPMTAKYFVGKRDKKTKLESKAIKKWEFVGYGQVMSVPNQNLLTNGDALVVMGSYGND